MRYFPPSLIAPLVADWAEVAHGVTGTVSVQLRDLEAPVAGRLDYSAHYAASTIKLGIGITALAEIESRRTDPHLSLTVRDTFPTATGREFQLHREDDNDDATWDLLGTTEAFGRLVERTIVDSSNIAANLVAQRVTLPAVARTLSAARASGLTMHHLFGDRRAQRSALHNTATADGLGRLMAALGRGHLLPEDATRTMLAMLARQTTRRMIPAGLPEATWSAGKPGWLGEAHHDVQLVRPGRAPEYILAVCTTTGLGDSVDDLIASISRITWEHWMTWHTL